MEIFRFSKMAAVRHLGFVMWVFGPPTKGAWWFLSLCKISFESMQYSFDNMQVLVFWDFGLKTPIHAPFLGVLGHTPKNVTHCPNAKKDRPWAEPRYLSHKAWISATRFELGMWRRKKDSTGQDRTGKKSHKKGCISPIWGEAPTEAMYIKNCVVGVLVDVITCAKFQNEISRGYDFTGGRTFHFPIDFWMGLTTVQRYFAACDETWNALLVFVYLFQQHVISFSSEHKNYINYTHV